MDIDVEDILRKVALDGSIDFSLWPTLLPIVISRIEKIVHNEFPIPNIPPPAPPVRPPSPRFLAPLPSSDAIDGPDSSDSTTSSQETNKENTVPITSSPAASAIVATQSSESSGVRSAPSQPPAEPASQPPPEPGQEEGGDSEQDAQTSPRLAPDELPPQIVSLLVEITTTLGAFTAFPPQTIQRLAELVLYPTAHYRSLTAYLHALDRVVHVTSGANIYPLPPAIPDMSALSILANGVSGGHDSHVEINSSSAAATIGSDEALGGALLTPIPWLARRATAAANGSDDGSDRGGGSPVGGGSPHGIVPNSQAQSPQQQSQHRPQVRTESTETIEGPNGVGSIETVSISINGIPSMGAGGGLLAQRGVTQGELLRQEQRAGVVPVSQLARHGPHPHDSGGSPGSGNANGGSPSALSSTTLTEGTAASSPVGDAEDTAMNEDTESEVPHARGPDEIGAADMGPQSETTSSFTINPGGAVEMHGIDVEAAVGRRAPHPQPATDQQQRASSSSPPARVEVAIPTRSPKREAAQDLDPGSHKRIKEETSSNDLTGTVESEDVKDAVKEDEEETKKIKTDAEGDVVLPDTNPGDVTNDQETEEKKFAAIVAADEEFNVKPEKGDETKTTDDHTGATDESDAKTQEGSSGDGHGEVGSG